MRLKRRDARKKTAMLISKSTNSFRDTNHCSIINELRNVACCHDKCQTKMSL